MPKTTKVNKNIGGRGGGGRGEGCEAGSEGGMITTDFFNVLPLPILAMYNLQPEVSSPVSKRGKTDRQITDKHCNLKTESALGPYYKIVTPGSKNSGGSTD